MPATWQRGPGIWVLFECFYAVVPGYCGSGLPAVSVKAWMHAYCIVWDWTCHCDHHLLPWLVSVALQGMQGA